MANLQLAIEIEKLGIKPKNQVGVTTFKCC